ncbi:hypothetical protein DN069_00005 [Streptacidiphilus pinicola]|uniref:Uncharacterized protein n=1 Tax=Streptacidiphilus pinicola TaxID=2219663 RepID=A0A2X0ISR1_9ACTN|nr:hypothetical protein [Streptacidiphilus pinicola]RAG87657.1 hypothetical protein DN069_00005 [Streptacidiphilus pinicola]
MYKRLPRSRSGGSAARAQAGALAEASAPCGCAEGCMYGATRPRSRGTGTGAVDRSAGACAAGTAGAVGVAGAGSAGWAGSGLDLVKNEPASAPV